MTDKRRKEEGVRALVPCYSYPDHMTDTLHQSRLYTHTDFMPLHTAFNSTE